MVSLRATGAEVQRPYYLALLAEGHSKAGQSEEGLAVLAEALAAGNESGERCWEAELYRLKGMLTLQSKVQSQKSEVPNPQHLAPSTQAEAEECFLKAISIARKQQAKSLELRAATSLSRLWQSQGKKSAARHSLADIYGWFTEGFDTGDLKEAKALLEELS